MNNLKKKILTVDDDRDDLLLLRQSMEKLSSIHIQQALNGAEALEILAKDKISKQLPNLIVMDLNMPVMDGRRTLHAIKEDSELKEIPLVVFTTAATMDDLTYLTKHKIETIIKPINWASYQGIAEKLLEYCK